MPGHKDIQRTMVYTRVLNRGGRASGFRPTAVAVYAGQPKQELGDRGRMGMKRAALAIFSLLLCSPVRADRIWTIEELSLAVVYLQRSEVERVIHQGVKKEVWLKGPGDPAPKPNLVTKFGTGFFVTDGSRLFLVTASHIAKQLDPGSQATFAGKGDKPETVTLTELSGTPNPKWVTHDIADVAVLRLTPTQETFDRYLKERFLPVEVLSTSDAAPGRETRLTVIGFPSGLGVRDRFSPLSLQSLPASGLLVLKRFDTQVEAEFFMLQEPSIGGYSGAPVIDVSRYVMGILTTTGSGTRIYGLIHGTLGDETGGKLAAVVPARFIIEALRAASKP